MFGFVVASASSLSDDEKARYQAVYCGLCRTLGQRYGQVSRAALTYDLTFFILLANSLNEPAEETGDAPCVMHPMKAMPYAQTAWTDYAADLSVALAYHKCLDDIADEGALAARAGRAALEGAYRQACERIPDQCAAIERAMGRIRDIEQAAQDMQSEERARRVILGECSELKDLPTGPDAAASEFGHLLGELFAYDQGFWAENMRALGEALGRFVYLMDAAVDYEADQKAGSYNPFATLESTRESMEATLQLTAASTAEVFERLPLEQDLHLLRSVLYEGIWIQFNRTYRE